MTTTREQQLEFCKVCTNRKFDAQRGLLCGFQTVLPILKKTARIS